VAHAVHQWREVWTRYATDLGADWVSGGPNRGFAPAQVRFANAARIEMLRPWAVEENDFLARFLERGGPGPHHLTFKVADLRAALDEASNAGFQPIGVDLSDPDWKEAFIHPKQASGVVVQLAESTVHADDPGPWRTPPPEGFPTDRRRRADGTGPIRPAHLENVVHAVDDPALAHSLFVDVLRGRIVAEGEADGAGWSAVSWGGPLGVRLVWPTASERADVHHATGAALRQWIAGRPGRVVHLELQADDPTGVPDAVPADDPLWGVAAPAGEPRWLVPAAANFGLALVLTAIGSAG
jgi:hypothetical protein